MAIKLCDNNIMHKTLGLGKYEASLGHVALCLYLRYNRFTTLRPPLVADRVGYFKPHSMARLSTGSTLPVLYDPISNNSVSLVSATRLAYAQQVTYMANVFHDVINYVM